MLEPTRVLRIELSGRRTLADYRGARGRLPGACSGETPVSHPRFPTGGMQSLHSSNFIQLQLLQG